MGKSSKVFTLIAAILIIGGCKSMSDCKKKKDAINAFVVEYSNRWSTSTGVDTTNCKSLNLIFLNDPYHLEGTKVLLYIDDQTIYKGDFKQKFRVYISKEKFERRVIPSMQVFKGKTEYNLIQKTSIFLADDDKFLYVVFCPDNDLVGSCYLFSQKEEIL